MALVSNDFRAFFAITLMVDVNLIETHARDPGNRERNSWSRSRNLFSCKKPNDRINSAMAFFLEGKAQFDESFHTSPVSYRTKLRLQATYRTKQRAVRIYGYDRTI